MAVPNVNIDASEQGKWSNIDTFISKNRNKVASDISSNISGITPSSLSGSHFELYFKSLPVPGKADDINFNNLVTDVALEPYILPMSDPYEVLCFGSKLVEQNFYLIFCCKNPNEPIKNLSVSKHFGVFFTSISLTGGDTSLI